MSDNDLKHAIGTGLSGFGSRPLAGAATSFLETLDWSCAAALITLAASQRRF